MEKIYEIPKEIRAACYKEQTDSLMLAAQGYEHEGNTVKSAEMWVLYDAKKAEIRAAYPDIP